jgi:predicted naringenin-chalcone synthase
LTVAHINRIATAVPRNDVHQLFQRFAGTLLAGEPRLLALFRRMASRSGIEHRFSSLTPAPESDGPALDVDGFFTRGRFPATGARMALFEAAAPDLAETAVRALDLGADLARVTHVIITSCTGFSAPGIDLDLVSRCGLSPHVERSFIGFMGCYAAINALKLARHIVRSEPASRVLCVNVELCTLHLQETADLEKVLSFLLFGDGCAAALVTAEPQGIALDRFHALIAPDTAELITWKIREQGFDMLLSGGVPGAIAEALGPGIAGILDGAPVDSIGHWAVHPGGKSVLDSVENALGLDPAALDASRRVLRNYGNMSSATVMFVLKAVLEERTVGVPGCAMSFGPGLTAETMLFHTV